MIAKSSVLSKRSISKINKIQDYTDKGPCLSEGILASDGKILKGNIRIGDFLPSENITSKYKRHDNPIEIEDVDGDMDVVLVVLTVRGGGVLDTIIYPETGTKKTATNLSS